MTNLITDNTEFDVSDPEETPELAPEHAELLLSLDRLLTVGSYYPAGHKQYQVVAEAAKEAVRQALGSAPSLSIEITSEGLSIYDAFISADQREARRLFDLLEPLNIALVEIHAGVSSEDLHEALTILKKYRNSLTGVRSYQEIEIEGLPSSIAVVSRSLYVKTRTSKTAPRGIGADQADFDPNTIPDSMLVPTPEGQAVEREFLAVIRGIAKNMNPASGEQLRNADDGDAEQLLSQWIPNHAISTIREVLDSIDQTASDPMMLSNLIGHAQTALELTGDPELVELIFEKLRNDGAEPKKVPPTLEPATKPRKPRRPRRPQRAPVKFTMTRREMRELVDVIDASIKPVDDLPGPSSADSLGVCFQILTMAPTDECVDGIASLVREVITSESFSDLDLRILTSAIVAVMTDGDAETVDRAVHMVRTPLRETHPELLGPYWLNVWNGLESVAQKEMAWPYLVNDLLMGLVWDNPGKKVNFYMAVSDLVASGRLELLHRLENMQALQERTLSPEIFEATAPLLYDVHSVLMRSSLSEEHGPRMLERLNRQKAQPLVTFMTSIDSEYHYHHERLYQAMLDQGTEEQICPALRDLAGRRMKGLLTNLPADQRSEPWVHDVVTWLGKLAPKRSDLILGNVIREKKYFFFPVWPAACREAARVALSAKEATGEPDEKR